MKAVAALLAAVLLTAPARGQAETPSPAVIVAMAQHFVQERLMFGEAGHYHIEFDVAQLYPQPQANYWAVAGGFVTDQTTPNTYVAAVRLVCPDFDEVVCWRLEKLAINGEIALDRGESL